jgi:hypothetical protein
MVSTLFAPFVGLMLLVVAAAILGAFLGLFVRPRLFAIAIALAASGGLYQAIALAGRMLDQDPGRQALARQIDLLVGLDGDSVWPVLAASGAGAIGAAILWSLARRQSTDSFWFPGGETRDRDGRIRLGHIEEREIHKRAESRFHDLMDQ